MTSSTFDFVIERALARGNPVILKIFNNLFSPDYHVHIDVVFTTVIMVASANESIFFINKKVIVAFYYIIIIYYLFIFVKGVLQMY